MKNLSKALTLLVVFAMLISSVASAANFSDVAEDSSYANGIGAGVALGLYEGYEDGTFKPEGDITRAEFATIVVRMLGQESKTAAGQTDFTDVAADYWAAGAINIASRLGIVNGYGDGKFGPDDNVKYEEAIKMLVVALGYAPTIDAVTGYPVAYLTKAGELGITNGVNGSNGSPANRGTVAQLVYNSLDVPLMKQSGYGTWVDYVIYDGYGDTEGNRQTVLSEYLGAAKFQVLVTNSSAYSSGSKKVETVDTTILKNYKTKWAAISDDYEVDANITMEVGDTNASSFVGQKALVFVKADPASNDAPVIVYIAKDSSSANTLTLDSDMIEDAVEKKGDDYITLSYRENESDRKATTVTIDADADLYINGGSSKADIVSALVTTENGETVPNFYGEVTLEYIDKGDDSVADYNTVFITKYTNVVVDTVNTRTYRVTPKNNASSIKFDPDDSTIKATLYDEAGNEMDWAELKEWDVLSVVTYAGSNKTVVNATLVNNNVTGTVTQVADEGTDTKYTIGGVEYKFDPISMEASDIALGDEGTFYLDQRDRIVYYDTTVSANNNYAYIMAIEEVGGVQTKAEMKLFLSDGTFATTTAANKVKVDGITGISSVDILNDMVLDNAKANASLIDKQGKTWFIMNENVIEGVKAVEAGQFITYTANANGEITSIDRAADDISLAKAKGKFTQFFADEGLYTYSEVGEYFTGKEGKLLVTDNTVIMACPTDGNGPSTDEDEYSLLSLANLSDDQEIKDIVAFNVNEDREVGAILVKTEVNITSTTTGLAVLTSSSSNRNEAGETVDRLVFSQDNEDGIAKNATEDYTIESASELVIGQIAIPYFNANDEIRKWEVVAEPDTKADATTFTLPEDKTSGSTKIRYFAGRVADVSRSTITYAPVDENGNYDTSANFVPDAEDLEDLLVKNSANIYIYDETISKASNRVISGNVLSDIMVRTADSRDAKDYDVEEGQVIYVDMEGEVVNVDFVAREVDNIVKDIIFYIYK